MKDNHVKWTLKLIDGKGDVVYHYGEEKNETLAIKKLWELSRWDASKPLHAIDAYFLSKDGARVCVSLVSGKVKR